MIHHVFQHVEYDVNHGPDRGHEPYATSKLGQTRPSLDVVCGQTTRCHDYVLLVGNELSFVGELVLGYHKGKLERVVCETSQYKVEYETPWIAKL